MPFLILFCIVVAWLIAIVQESYNARGLEKMTRTDIKKIEEMTIAKPAEQARQIYKEYLKNIRQGNYQANEALYKKYKALDSSLLHKSIWAEE